MTNALKDLNTFVVEKVTTETDSTSAAPWRKARLHRKPMGKAQASSATCVEMVRGAEVFLTKSKDGRPRW